MLTKSRVLQLIFMLIVLLTVFFWRTFSVLEESKQEVDDTTTTLSLVRCDYQNACDFITEQGTFLLNIKKLPIKAEQWIDFELATPNAEIRVSDALIVGKSMFMGKIPVTFKQSSEQLFIAKAIVVACMHDEMIWTLQITVANGNLKQQLAFDFLVKH